MDESFRVYSHGRFVLTFNRAKEAVDYACTSDLTQFTIWKGIRESKTLPMLYNVYLEYNLEDCT